MIGQNSKMPTVFVEKALRQLVEQVSGYCQSRPAILEDLPRANRAREFRRYLMNADALVAQMEKLIRMARDIPSLRHMDLEMIEARVEELRGLVRDLAPKFVSQN